MFDLPKHDDREIGIYLASIDRAYVALGADPLEPDSMDPAYIGEAVEKALARLKAHVALAEAQSQEAWTKLMEVKKERDDAMSDEIPQAAWNIELHADCPACKDYVDLILAPDFWDGRKLEVGQNKEGEEVVCPECGHEFRVDVVY